ncbi:hypothetical protein [Flagellimonas sp.]|uniref:hypothetical protein n=1 Tax=Flagellimonas sp. TaxID=2058762 RepID=UPI003BAC4866
MIYQLCNLGNEHHIDTFFKVAVFKADNLPYFSHLTKDLSVQDIITNLPDESEVILSDLLPNNVQVAHNTRFSANGKLYNTNIGFTLTPQDKNLQELLEGYNTQEVVVMVSKRNTSHLYGTKAQPLTFTYSELNSPQPGAMKGYTLDISGSTYGKSRLFEQIQFNVYERGLAFELAQPI